MTDPDPEERDETPEDDDVPEPKNDEVEEP